MSSAALHILMSLATGERHGYAVKQDIEERTRGELVLGPGTLYEAIHRMLRDGWIEEVQDAAPAATRGRPRYYRIAAAGLREMEAELRRLERLVEDARSRRLLPDTRAV